MPILWFSIFSFLSGFAQDYSQLLALRTLQGLLALARDHPIADLERVCGRAVHLGLWRLREVRRDVADLVGIRPGRAHAVLRLAHLRGRDHFHGLGDLLRVLEALDLAAYLFACCHDFFLRSP